MAKLLQMQPSPQDYRRPDRLLRQGGSKLIADLTVCYKVTDEVTLTVGANNLFDIHPDRVNPAGLAASAAAGNPAVEVYPAFSPFGINGRFYCAKVGWRF